MTQPSPPKRLILSNEEVNSVMRVAKDLLGLRLTNCMLLINSHLAQSKYIVELEDAFLTNMEEVEGLELRLKVSVEANAHWIQINAEEVAKNQVLEVEIKRLRSIIADSSPNKFTEGVTTNGNNSQSINKAHERGILIAAAYGKRT